MFFEYPKDIRKVIYTTNAIESLNSVIRTAVNKRKVFPSDQAAFKVVYLATEPPRLYRRVFYLSQAAMPDRVKLS